MYVPSHNYTFVSSASAQHCDLHHSVAKLYLDTLSSDQTVKRKSRRKRRTMSTGIATMETDTFAKDLALVMPALEDCVSVASSGSSSASSDCGEQVSSTDMRALLASSMSTMYRQEVPLYGTLLSIISEVNSDVLLSHNTAVSEAEERRISVERHGAIRVGTAQELNTLARIFSVFGMCPVGYYDLYKDAGLPIHATAFRAIDPEELERNPFRLFCSLLRVELIQNTEVRSLAENLLSRRQIVSDRCMQLLSLIETSTLPVSRSMALEFVDEVVDIFRWHASTSVSAAEYEKLHSIHPLVADIVSFRGPHINHLTPRTLDIDQVQQIMLQRGIDAKEIIEGPPARKCPIYLRQTSFHALSEPVLFEGVQGKHKARFGEIEARGQALSRKGAALYDQLMSQVNKQDPHHSLVTVFQQGFPDDLETIRQQGLGYFTYSVDRSVICTAETATTISALVASGVVKADPIVYEDFLPASAAGIFQSNLPQSGTAEKPMCTTESDDARQILETAIGAPLLDYHELYQLQQDASLRQVARELCLDLML